MEDITRTPAWRSAEAEWLEQPDERDEDDGPDWDLINDEAKIDAAEREQDGNSK
jgi:hypothetical protein